MSAYAAGRQCLMQLLTEALDDPASGPCGRCSVCTGEVPAPGRTPSRDSVAQVYQSLRRRPIKIQPRKIWPPGTGRTGRISGIGEGRAIVPLNGGAWPDLPGEVLGEDRPVSPLLRKAFDETLTRWRREDMPTVGAVIPMPSESHPRLVGGLAELAAHTLGVPVRDVLAIRADGQPHAEGSAGRLQQVSQRLFLPNSDQLHGNVLLVDDYATSRWTITHAAQLLRQVGVDAVLPFVAVADAQG